jgi:hypothetical protein
MADNDPQQQPQQPPRGGGGEAAPNAAADDAALAADDPAPAQVLPPFRVVWDELADPFPHLLEEHEARLRRREQALEDEDGENYDDSSDSDDETNLVVQGQEVLDPCLAASTMTDVMYTYKRYRIRDVTVNFNYHVSADWRRHNTGRDDDHDDDYAVQLRRFVNVLEVYFRIRTLRLTRANFWRGPRRLLPNEAEGGGDDDEGGDDGFDPTLLLEDKSLKKLFGEVLPKHLSLREVTISNSRIQPPYWKLFTEKFLLPHNWNFVRLALESTPLTLEGCRLLQRMLQRKVRLFQLKLDNCGLGNDEWHVVSEGIRDNTHLHTVTLIERDVTVQPGTLLPLLQKPSFVKQLEVRAAGWSAEAFEELVRALRTNTVLCDLTVHCDRRRAIPHLPLVEELLTTYNYALETVTVRPCGDRALLRRLDALLERNKRVRALGGTARSRHASHEFYRFPSRAVWPRVLGAYSRFATLMYRFVRKANLEAFANQVQPAAALAPPAARHVTSPVQLALMMAAPKLQDLLAAQHSADHVQSVVAAVEAEEAQAAANQAQPAVEAQPASQDDSKKRRHQLVSD